jgi:hypothetical protein
MKKLQINIKNNNSLRKRKIIKKYNKIRDKTRKIFSKRINKKKIKKLIK